jgi:hypothetical protein
VFYELTDEAVNTGPQAQIPWRAQVEPPDPRGNPFGGARGFGEAVPATSSVERAGGGASAALTVPLEGTTSGRPDPTTLETKKKILPFLEEKSDDASTADESPKEVVLKRKQYGGEKTKKHKSAKATALSKR